MPLMIAAALKVSKRQRGELEAIARSRSLPHRKVVQAKALLLAADEHRFTTQRAGRMIGPKYLHARLGPGFLGNIEHEADTRGLVVSK